MKKFLASLLGIVIFFLLVPACTIFIAREIMSEDTIRTIVDYVPGVFDEEQEDGTSEDLIESFMSTLDSADPRLAEQFDEEELKDEIIIMFSKALENLGNPEAEYLIDTTSFKKYLETGIEKYEKETGVEIEDDLVETVFAELDEEMMISKDTLEAPEVLTIFETIYSNQILLTLVSGIVLCIILIVILLGDISSALLKIKTPFIINGLGGLGIGYLINSILATANVNDLKLPQPVLSQVTSPFFKVGIASLVLGIVLIIVAKILKKNRSIENSNNALENLGNVNYVPNNNISNTPYNGYQNH